MKRAQIIFAALAFAGHLHAEEVRDIPLEKCSASQVLMAIDFASLARYTKAREATVGMWHKLTALSEKHPNAPPDRPVGDSLTRTEADNFTNVSSQIAVSNMYSLAESRLQRDTNVLQKMLEASANLLYEDKLPDEKSSDFKYYRYLGALREAYVGLTHPDAKNTAECSLDLAFQRDLNDRFKQAASKLEDSRQYLELLGLRTKYGLADGIAFDPDKLSKSDAARLPELQRYVQSSVSRMQYYSTDISDLRYFAEMVQLQFDEQKAEILQLGPSRDRADFTQLRAAKFNTLSKPMQMVWNLWDHIDGETPSQAVKDFKMIAETLHGGSPKP